MTLVGELHDDHGAVYRDHGPRSVVANYGRPESAALAVRNGAGVIEMGYGVVVIEGDDRVDYVDNAVSNRVPTTDGQGTYALLLDPQGSIETELYIYNAGERLLLFVPPDRVAPLVDDWQGKIFIQDVEIRDATTEFGVFGVHGSASTEKIASVLNGAGAPEPGLTFVRGRMDSVGVTVVATDGLLGEEGYEVICSADDAPAIFETLLTRGYNAAPFGYDSYEILAAEAGTPLFHTGIRDQIPNVVGLRNALDFEKGCYVGQEVVSKVENRGRPSKRLVGLRPEKPPESGAAVFAGDAAVGEVTHAIESPTVESPIALAFLKWGADTEALTVRIDGEELPATRVDLPFVDGSKQSARLPTYPTEAD